MNIFNIFSKSKVPLKQNLSKLNEDWDEPVIFAIGGLTEIGFYDKWNYFLVNSHQGRGVFDCTDSTRIARDNNVLNNEDINYNQRTIKGIGPLQGKNVHCIGLWGGNLSTKTNDGWSIEIFDTDKVIVSSPDKVSIKFSSPITELRAVGFSTNGKTFVYATSSEIILYVRKNHKTKLIMPKLPLLEKSYNSPRIHDDVFMHDVILMACNWKGSGWINLALNWLDEGFEIDREIIDSLEKALSNTFLSQQLKHRIFAIVKNWKNINYTYIDVKWIHKNKDEPIRIVSELNEVRFEERKLEYFVGGAVKFADEYNNLGDTCLGKVHVPLEEEINLDNQFEAVNISKSKFDKLWFKCNNKIENN